MIRYWAFRITAALVPLIPARIARPGAWALGVVLWALAPRVRRRVDANLRHIPALADDPVRRRAAVRGVFCHTALNYLDFFRGPHLTDDDLLPNWIIENEEAYHAVMAQGRGFILVTGHFGNWEFGVSRLGALGARVVAPVERMQPPELFDLFCRLRNHHDLRVVPADSRDSLREMLEALKHNEIVALVVDRYVLGSSVEVPFFGTPAKLPTGPYALALRGGVPLMAVFCWRESLTVSRGRFIPLDITSAPNGEAKPAAGEGRAGTATRTRVPDATLRAMHVFIAELEKVIAAHPEQWVASLSRIWDV